MRRLTFHLLVALVTFSIGIAAAMFWVAGRSRTTLQPEVKPVSFVECERSGAAVDEAVSFKDGRVDYQGVGFSYDTAIFSEVRARTVAANPLEDEFTEKEPAPEHLAFRFTARGDSLPESRVYPEIFVYPVAEYRRAVAAGPKMTEWVNDALAKLKSLLDKQPRSFKGDVPSLPIPDGFYAFRARAKYLDFRNGKGLGFLTQGQQDVEYIGNDHMTYEFDGLTADGLYYIHAEFPAAHPILEPESGEDFGSYVLPNNVFTRQSKQGREYFAYTGRVARRLEQLSPGEFQPDLRVYDALMSSLEVKR